MRAPRRDGEMHLLRAADRRGARIEADKPDQPIPDGAVQTACQGACPTRAITLRRPERPGSAVVAARAQDPRNYALLGELNTRPRTTYMAERAPAPTAGRRAEHAGRLSAARAASCQSGAELTAAGRCRREVTRRSHSGTRAGWRWWIAFAGALALVGLLVASLLGSLLYQGSAIWGNNIPVTWALDIVSYDWWIGVASGGLLVSSLLLLLGLEWRGALNRITETMALIAAAAAGLYPIIHLGRPWFFFWNLPYPNTFAALAAVSQPAGTGTRSTSSAIC